MSSSNNSFETSEIEAVFTAFPDRVRARLLFLRRMIFETATKTTDTGEIQETLKWGQPAYLTVSPKSGTTIRLGQTKRSDQYALYVHCQTTLIKTFSELYPDDFKYIGNRGILFSVEDEIPIEKLCQFIGMALTYHSTK